VANEAKSDIFETINFIICVKNAPNVCTPFYSIFLPGTKPERKGYVFHGGRSGSLSDKPE
jgi:hypothetical protein